MDELWDRRVEHRKAGRPIKATGEEECLFNSALTLFDYMIASIAVDLRIGQLVDVPNVGVTVILPLDILSVVLRVPTTVPTIVPTAKISVASLGVDICPLILIWAHVVE